MKNFEYKIKIGWRLIILLLAACAFLPAETFGQSSDRWLLIFETTSSMRHRTNGILNEVQDLLSTGMHGQMHPGDTIGIWTFDDRLHTGEAPLQVWSPEASRMIVQHTMQFVSEQQYSRSAHLQEMLTNMFSIVGSSPFITVLLFTDAAEPISGTPFDAQINSFYKDNYHDLKKGEMPVVTVLRGVHGQLTTNTLNSAPWPVDIPFEPNPPPPRPKPHVAAPKPAPRPTVPPLIFIGKPQTRTAPEPAAAPPNEPAAYSNGMETNLAAPRSEAPTTPSAAVQEPSPGAGTAASTVEPAVPAAAQDSSPEQQSAVATTGKQESDETTARAVSPGMTEEQAGTSAQNSNSFDSGVASSASASPEAVFSARNIAIASVAFAVIVCGLLIMTARHARSSQASLITRSMDRERS